MITFMKVSPASNYLQSGHKGINLFVAKVLLQTFTLITVLLEAI